MKLHLRQPSGAERAKAVVVLQASEGTFDRSASPVKVAPQRTAQRLLALTLGVLSTLSGRAARALAAYDGR